MALLANQLMDARVLNGMNGRLDLPQFMRVQNQGTVSQVTTTEDDTRKNRKYPCPLCGKRFRFNSILSLHMRTHTGEKPFKCPYCDHRAAQKGNLKIHLRTHKQGNLGKGRVRVREENRLLHELEERAILRDKQIRGALPQPPHIPSPQQPQQQLPQLALTHTQLSLTPSGPVESLSLPPPSVHLNPIQEDHIQTPPTPAGFRCSFCKGKFRKQQELERHIRILHKPYKCTLCEFAASQEEELISHVETAHITSEAAQGQKPAGGSGRGSKPAGGEFPCEVCGQTFNQAWFLKGHMRKHKDSFEHCCQICGRRFKEPWFLKNHMKVHLNKLAAKSKLPAVPDVAVSMSSVVQDTHTNLYSQYISSLHSRFLSAERAGQSEFHQALATAGIRVKVKEMLGKMLAPGQGLTGGENHRSLLGLNPLIPPLSSSNMAEYLQAASERDSLHNHSYPGWQIMAPGLTVEQVYTPKEQQQREYLAERRVSVRDPESTRPISRPNTPGLSHVLEGSLSGTGLSHTGSVQEDSPLSCSPASAVTGEKPYRCPPSSDYTSPPTASLSYHLERLLHPQWQDSRDPSSSSPRPPSPKLKPRDHPSPAAGPYSGLELEGHDDGRRIPDALPSDLSNLHGVYQGTEESNLTSQSPIQTFVNNITSSFLREDRGRGRGRGRGRRGGRGSVGGGERSSEVEDCIGVRGSDGEGEAGTGSSTVKPRKSQYEPLDLSLRPEWVMSASQQPSSGPMDRFPAGGLLQQPSANVCNGSLSSSALRLQVYCAAPSESTAVENPPQSEQGPSSDPGLRVLKDQEQYGDLQDYDSSSLSGGEQGAAESPVCNKEEEEEEEEEEEVSKWSMMESSNSSEMMQSEMMVEGSHRLSEASQCPKEKQGQWGRSLIQPPLSPLELLMPGQAHHHHHHHHHHQYHMNMLSILRSSSGLDHRVPNGHTGSSNGGEVTEGVDPPGQKPFQCRYCPYSASQKGNLKTHVLCVHRRPFDSSQYPDRRLRRPYTNAHSPHRDRTPLEGSSHLPQGITGDAPTPGIDITMASLCGT